MAGAGKHPQHAICAQIWPLLLLLLLLPPPQATKTVAAAAVAKHKAATLRSLLTLTLLSFIRIPTEFFPAPDQE